MLQVATITRELEKSDETPTFVEISKTLTIENPKMSNAAEHSEELLRDESKVSSACLALIM